MEDQICVCTLIRLVMKKLISLFIIVLLTILSIGPAAASDWKSLRSENNKRLVWHSCTVLYSIDGNGHSTKALKSAIKETEKVSGVDFRRVAWSKSDLKIKLTSKKNKKYYAYINYFHDNNIDRGLISVYRGTLRASYKTQLNVYRHELGHALGLDHVKGSDVMNARTTSSRTRTAWRAGLKHLYRGC